MSRKDTIKAIFKHLQSKGIKSSLSRGGRYISNGKNYGPYVVFGDEITLTNNSMLDPEFNISWEDPKMIDKIEEWLKNENLGTRR